MPNSLCKIFILTAALLLVSAANAARIDIVKDDLNAYAVVTYDPGGITNPGTTRFSYSGQAFARAEFHVLDLFADRSATVVVPGGSIDMTSYYAFTGSMKNGDFYDYRNAIGTIYIGPAGPTGYALAVSRLRLEFLVSDGDSAMDLYAFTGENATAFLGLYDMTLGVWVETLHPDTWLDGETADDVVLTNNHRYVLFGYLYTYTPMGDDPSCNFGFRFDDLFWVGR